LTQRLNNYTIRFSQQVNEVATVVKIQQKIFQKSVDKGAERHYNSETVAIPLQIF
jgi:hypothetical protein